MGLGKLFENYVDIFDKFGTHTLKESDEMLGYYVFDVTDISIGLCSKRILNCLLGEGIIDDIIFEKSTFLIKKFRALEGTPLWNLESVRNSPEWANLLRLSDEIKELIKAKWTEDEMLSIFGFTQQIDLNED